MIVAVAFFHKDTGLLCTLPKPNRHADVIHALYQIFGKQIGSGWTQGFIDETGKFYDRKQAATHVLEVGQEVTEHCRKEYEGRTMEILFSEDVW